MKLSGLEFPDDEVTCGCDLASILARTRQEDYDALATAVCMVEYGSVFVAGWTVKAAPGTVTLTHTSGKTCTLDQPKIQVLLSMLAVPTSRL